MHDQLMIKTAAKLVPHIKKELEKARDAGEINISDIDTLSYFFVYGQLGMLLGHGSEKDCSKRIQDTLIEILNL